VVHKRGNKETAGGEGRKAETKTNDACARSLESFGNRGRLTWGGGGVERREAGAANWEGKTVDPEFKTKAVWEAQCSKTLGGKTA